MTSYHRSRDVFQADHEAREALRAAQWTFGPTSGLEVFGLRLDLATPAAITAEKANAPAIGLPTLDGFLGYIAFQAALDEAIRTAPHLSRRLIWQWNTALRDPNTWIDFRLPLRTVQLQGTLSMFDCSVGLPIDRAGNMLVPAGGFFIRNSYDLVTHPEVADSIPLRRRVSDPFGRPLSLKNKLVMSEGTTKSIDNRLYFPLTTSYVFFFRGDCAGVERLLQFAQTKDIGLGKKTSLGYGQIASYEIVPRPDITATWAFPVFGNRHNTLIKSVPFDLVYGRRETPDHYSRELFGCERYAFIAIVETLGTYRPPYWLRERRTQIAQYGSVIQER